MKKQLTAIRLSHIAAQQGVGSIARLENDYTGVIVDTRHWFSSGIPDNKNELKNVRRIQRCLEVPQRLYLPPTGNEDNDSDLEKAIPAVLFPNYLQCVECGQLDLNPWLHNPHKSTSKPRCTNCSSGVMSQGTYCVVDNFGNLDDVGWNYLCHYTYDDEAKHVTPPMGGQEKCYRSHHSNYLQVKFKNGRHEVTCTNCSSVTKFEPSKLGLKPIKPQPWICETVPKEPDGIKRKGEVVEINHPSVYSPIVSDGLVIPPESNNDGGSTEIGDVLKYSDDFDGILNAPNNLLKKRRLSQLARKLDLPIEEIEKALNAYEFGCDENEDQELIGTPGQMKEEEYGALITKQTFSPSADFKTLHLTSFFNELRLYLPQDLLYISYIIKDLIKVERLRKVQVFNGFLRSQRDLEPVNESGNKSKGSEGKDDYQPQVVQPNIIGDAEWLPAINLYGEGIFISLNPNWLRTWAGNEVIARRVNELALHYEQSESQLVVDELTPEFVLLHTLSHLVIRELEDKCGYPASSLSERIYSSREADMNGFLIYTAVADKSGSLGGLMELAEPKSFLAILDSAIKRAQWCTLDPVCSDHGGQGRDGLNRAACHGCTLVPDTSCDYGNVFLDRVLIKGDREHGVPSLVEFIRENLSE
ncbi:DUF1998 domain-containing protein [Aliivibrio fischeri]|uniref:DUF1998 domain-containing protein n=1 Tax=Aliivibrio fischeri TaxID=668 RepID=UPI0012D93E30|nr:DUF1998 domain-containing protein [Aliivibrio fischeri]MUK26209.1 DUF1998 domain-containing protein [Aliivibrio fischeri]MUK33826.1 DUF1998 domain-containing protein [Aliivibrio fischeri]